MTIIIEYYYSVYIENSRLLDDSGGRDRIMDNRQFARIGSRLLPIILQYYIGTRRSSKKPRSPGRNVG